MFEYFTEKAIAVIMASQEEARLTKQGFVGTEQLLVGFLKEDDNIASTVLKKLGITLDLARSEVNKIISAGSGFVPHEIPFTPKVKQVFEQAFQEARQFDHRYIGPEHLLLSLLKQTECVAVKVLEKLRIDLEQLQREVIQATGEGQPAMSEVSPNAVLGRSGRSTTRALDEYGVDLTQKAAQGILDPVIGRQKEIERLVQILGRRTKNNPVLVGEPGVGKTAIAEGLAQHIVNQDVPELLLNKRVFMLDMGLLLAGTRFRGDFEERMSEVVSEVQQNGNIILVIDEIHTLVGAGGMEGGMDAANLLKPALARGSLQCIGATTLDEYRKHIERDAALERRFQPIMVGEPTVEESVAILRGLRQRYEQHHQLEITDEALESAAHLAYRYISDRFLPDKAIDLIDEAGSRVRFRHEQKSPNRELKRNLRQVTKEKETAVKSQDFDKASELRDRELELEAQLAATVQPKPMPEVAEAGAIARPQVTAEDIAQVVTAWTGIPVNQLTESESAMLSHLEDILHERVIGQHEAVTAAARAIRRSRVGLKNPSRPIASLFFSGPTGVGKTELTKALAAALFGSEEAMIRLDMSEFMEPHTVSKLIGSPPGYVGYDEGGQLTEAVRRKPYTVILLDEVEKAHPDVFNLLLQLLEDGRLTDSRGRVVHFQNTLVIMTSNLGSRVIEKGGARLGFDFSSDDSALSRYHQIRDRVNEDLKQHFRPEFLNRLDEIIVFRQLQREEVRQIADLMIQEVANRLSQQAISLEVTAAVKERLVTEGYDPSYGARPLRRTITRLLEDHLAEAMLTGAIAQGDTAILDLDEDNQIQIRKAESKVLQPVH